MTPFNATETVTLIGATETPVDGVVVVYGEPSATQAGDQAQQKVQIIDPAHTAIQAGAVLRIRGQLARVLGVQDHTHPWTGWRPPSIIHAVQVNPVLPDVGTLTRKTGETFNRTTNLLTPTWVTVWSGACAVGDAQLQGRQQTTAEQNTSTVPVTVSVPLDVVDVHPDDVFTVTASQDARLVGRKLRVTSATSGTTEPVRRLTAFDHLEA